MIVKRILAGACSVLLVASIGLAYSFQRAYKASEKAKAELVIAVEGSKRARAQREKDAATLQAWAVRNGATARELASAKRDLQTALDANAEWAATQVPPAVRSSILSDSERSGSVPE